MQKKLVLPYNVDYVELNKEANNFSLENLAGQEVFEESPDNVVQNNDLIFSMYEKELKEKIKNEPAQIGKNSTKDVMKGK